MKTYAALGMNENDHPEPMKELSQLILEVGKMVSAWGIFQFLKQPNISHQTEGQKTRLALATLYLGRIKVADGEVHPYLDADTCTLVENYMAMDQQPANNARGRGRPSGSPNKGTGKGKGKRKGTTKGEDEEEDEVEEATPARRARRASS